MHGSVRDGLRHVDKPNFWANYEIVHCRDGKARRIGVEPSEMVNGIPTGMVEMRPIEVLTKKEENRVVKLRGYGNAIVPELAAEFVRAGMEAIAEIERGCTCRFGDSWNETIQKGASRSAQSGRCPLG